MARHTVFNCKTPILGWIATWLLAAALVPQARAGVHEELTMALDQSGVSLSGSVQSGTRDTFLFAARRGQHMALKIDSVLGNVSLDLLMPGPSAAQPIDGNLVPGSAHREALSLQAPQDGKYLVVLTPGAGIAHYRLWLYVSDLDPRPAMAAAQKAMTRPGATAPRRYANATGMLATGVPLSRQEQLQLPRTGGWWPSLLTNLYVLLAVTVYAGCYAVLRSGMRGRGGDGFRRAPPARFGVGAGPLHSRG